MPYVFVDGKFVVSAPRAAVASVRSVAAIAAPLEAKVVGAMVDVRIVSGTPAEERTSFVYWIRTAVSGTAIPGSSAVTADWACPEVA